MIGFVQVAVLPDLWQVFSAAISALRCRLSRASTISTWGEGFTEMKSVWRMK